MAMGEMALAKLWFFVLLPILIGAMAAHFAGLISLQTELLIDAVVFAIYFLALTVYAVRTLKF
jgi:hypothetical protein